MLKIVSAALYHNGTHGGQCKEWVQKVIREAIGAIVPANSAEISHLWKQDSSGRVSILSANIALAISGDVVQMVLKSRSGGVLPHTAIVGSNQNRTIVWLESNYKGDEMVTVTRAQSHEEFFSSLSNGLFSLYRIR